MKKTLTLLAILAAIGPAWGAEVVSSNIVGYDKISLQKGLNMIGVQFLLVGGEAQALSTVGTLDNEMAGFDEDGNYDSEMRVWNGKGYTTYGWSGTSGTDVLENSSLDNKWLNLDLEEDEDAIADKGSGFWITAGSAGNITISGEVPATATVEQTVAAGLNMLANPYPANVKISDFGTLDNTFAGFDEDGNYATEMRVWNGKGYTTYGWSGTSGTDVLENSSLDNKWLNLDLELEETELPIGHAVWITAEKAGTITFKNPTISE